ncbi:MAG: hypothetical protein K5984_01005 [Bacteroidales bacterium]|nr:hypothetical protein [Bacteroidales bacterium]
MSGQTDSLFREIDSTTVWAKRREGHMKAKSGGALSLEMKQMDLLPKILGTADPMHYATLLPGVQTASEMDGSVHILGSENAHNNIALGNVPIYGASHLLGLFSVFNSDHFESMDYNQNAKAVSRLGGELKMVLQKKIPEKMSLSASLGPVATQATIGLPAGEKCAVFLSGRRSFLNLMYSGILSADNMNLEYGFTDLNATVLCRPTKKDIIQVNGYFGQDDAAILSEAYTITSDMGWGNKAASADWTRYTVYGKLTQSLYATTFSFDGNLSFESMSIALPSSLESYGYKVDATIGGLNLIGDIIYHKASPQAPSNTGSYIADSEPEHQKGWESLLGASYRIRPLLNLSAEAGLSVPAFFTDYKNYVFLDPALSITYHMYEKGKLSLNTGFRHQMLFQTGFSDLGLPVEFWFLAGEHSDPQSSAYITLDYSRSLGHGAWDLTVNAYFKHLDNQIDYDGTAFDLISASYDLDDVLLKGRGNNFGANIMLTRNVGPVTGWISYSFGKALRRFPELSETEWYPANHERTHELDAVATYTRGKWDFGGTLVLASGNPFTPAEYVYLFAKQILVNYGEHNSDRLPMYARLDLSANWNCFKTRLGEGGINFSLYNAFGNPNIYAYTIHFSNTKDGFTYQARKSFMRFLPSISIYFKI